MRAGSSQAIGNRVFRVSGLSEWQVGALKKLAAFGMLEQNWNSYGSGPISESILDLGAELISSLSLEHLSMPRIVPISGGGIQFSWTNGVSEIEIELLPDLSAAILAATNGEPVAEFPIRRLNARLVEHLLAWLDTH
jgi:hypothetical protein